MTLIVDVQGFKTDENRFIFKEIAFISFYEDNLIKSYLLKPPFPWSHLSARYKSSNAWLIRNFHGLPWYSGNVSYNFLHEGIEELNQTETVYVKGSEKRAWLLTTFPNIKYVLDFDDLGCPSLVQLQKNNRNIQSCSSHCVVKGTVSNCAVRNVKLLKCWLYNLE